MFMLPKPKFYAKKKNKNKNVRILVFPDLNYRLWCLTSLPGFVDMDP